MKNCKNIFLFILSVSFFFNVQIFASESNMLGKTAPDFTLQDLNGNKVNLSDFSGKVVILNFWATWCPPCIKEIPDFIKLYDKYKDHGFVMLGLSVDQQGISRVKAFKQQFNVNYPILMADINVSDAYGNISNIPTTFVIDTKGKIQREYVGYRTKGVFEKDIKDLLPNLKLDTLESPTSKYADELNKIGIADRPESDNAAPNYIKAIELYKKEPDGLNAKSKNLSQDLTTQDKTILTKWVEDNTPALEQIKIATQKPYCWFKYTGSEIQPNPHLTEIRKLAIVLQTRAYLNAQKGDINSVINDIITLYKYGTHLYNGPKILSEKMIGTVIKSISTSAAFHIIDNKMVNASLIKEMGNSFKKIVEDYDEPFDLRGEKIYMQEKIDTDFTDNFYKKHLAGTLEYIDMVAARTPWKLHNDKASLSTNPWIEIIAPAISRTTEIDFRSKAEVQALITTLAALQFYNEKSRYPATLSQLVTEGYLKELPNDPFSNKPLVYRPTQQGFILYSFGADLDDDGGRYSKWGYGENGGDQVFWPVEQNS